MTEDPATTPTPSLGADLRSRYLNLSPILGDRWMAAQAALDGHFRAPLFGWVNPSGPDYEFLDELADAAVTLRTLPGLNAHLRRLQGPTPEFWAALCELKMAVRLTRAGIPATLHSDTPDIRAHMDGGTVGIELTAGFPTLRFRDLQEALTHAWNNNGRLILLCPDETYRFLTTERDALIDRVQSVVYDDLEDPVVPGEDLWPDDGYIYRDEAFELDERRVPTGDIVDPARLEVFVSPAPYPVVVNTFRCTMGLRRPMARHHRSRGGEGPEVASPGTGNRGVRRWFPASECTSVGSFSCRRTRRPGASAPSACCGRAVLLAGRTTDATRAPILCVERGLLRRPWPYRTRPRRARDRDLTASRFA